MQRGDEHRLPKFQGLSIPGRPLMLQAASDALDVGATLRQDLSSTYSVHPEERVFSNRAVNHRQIVDRCLPRPMQASRYEHQGD